MGYRSFERLCGDRPDYSGPLGPYLGGFARHLRAQGYSLWISGYYVGIAKELSRWLENQSARLRNLDSGVLTAYLRNRGGRIPLRSEDRSALRRLVEYMHLEGALPSGRPRVVDIQLDGTRNTGYERPPVQERALDMSSFGSVERDYERYLACERGILATTREDYLRYVRRFLVRSGATKWREVRRLTPTRVTSYVAAHVGDFGRGSAKAMAKALRSFLRYLYLRSKTRVDLSLCVPTVPSWRLASVPKFITSGQVKSLLATCDRESLHGKRDYAILLTLARLGLRAGEVAALTLEDIDWQTGEFTVAGKGGQRSSLPIPVDVGRAIVDYLKNARPKCASRRLFIRDRGPWTGFTNSGSVSSVVRRAIRLAGLNPPRKGAHVLRHTLATRLLARGATLFEIAEVLRHRHPDTTALYAKVDFRRLRSVAPEWPGSAR